jgi:hypothetical protein
VHIVVSRTTSTEAMSLYRSAIVKYLRLIEVLHPHHSFTINHHLALHIPLYVGLHGPCHSQWAFPFERLIGRLQKVPLNNHAGE